MISNKSMEFNQIDKSLPFFAYGIFKPGEIGFLAIKIYVERVEKISIKGELFVRGGMLLYSGHPSLNVDGYLLYFKKGVEDASYRYINNMEPVVQYKWIEKSCCARKFNMLCGRFEKQRNEKDEYKYSIEESEWNGIWEDIFFKDAIHLLRTEPIKADTFNNEFLYYQMQYLLLWTIIERFLVLRYGESNRDNLANNDYFKQAVMNFGPSESRRITGFKDNNMLCLNLKDSRDTKYRYAVKYYYQMRCNITHRGKGISKDIEALKLSLRELLDIICDVIDNTKKECEEDKRRYEINGNRQS